jgi:hypothetical protein
VLWEASDRAYGKHLRALLPTLERIATLVSYISQFMMLEAGDIITTGTPRGVGLGKKPAPIFFVQGIQCD